MNIEAADFDAELEQVLRMVGEFMGVGRCFVFQLSEDGKHHRITHVWTAPLVLPDPDVVGIVVQEGFPWLGAKMLRHENIVVNGPDDLPAEASLERSYVESKDIRSFLMCPMFSRDLVVGNIGLDMVGRARTWNEEDIARVRLLGDIIANSILHLRKDKEILRLQQRLKDENTYLREEVALTTGYDEIVGDSDAIRRVLADAKQVAATESTVVIQGETGTGKELIAKIVHRLSGRNKRPLVSINCAALPSTLIESELFGREKGAYTGALSMQVGRFEVADGSTLFLDEVGDLPIDAQPKLLRVLESGEFERLGSSRTIKVDVRVIAATNQNLAEKMRRGAFRSDLYYRLDVFPISVPPLRDRPEDITSLIWHFVKQFEKSMGRRIDRVDKSDIERLQRYSWPGNVRELRNVVEQAMIRAQSETLRIKTPAAVRDVAEDPMTLDEVEKKHILGVLEQADWRVRGSGGAAERLGLKPTTLESKMRRLGIQRQS